MAQPMSAIVAQAETRRHDASAATLKHALAPRQYSFPVEIAPEVTRRHTISIEAHDARETDDLMSRFSITRNFDHDRYQPIPLLN
jgi:hypothetical protein